jgi:anti-anti-sigma regulatory factor
MKSEKIYLKKQAIAFRDDAKKIERTAMKLAKKTSLVYVDFKAVKFISRGFADEFINVTERLKNAGISLKTKNTAPNLKQMMALVRHTRKNILQKAGSFRI